MTIIFQKSYQVALRRYLLECNANLVGTMKDSFIEGLDRCFVDIELNHNYSVTTLLDPRLKEFFFLQTLTKIHLERILSTFLLTDNVDVLPKEPNRQNVVELE